MLVNFQDLTFGLILFFQALAKEDTDAAVQSILYRENYVMKVRISYKMHLRFFFHFQCSFYLTTLSKTQSFR